MYKRDPERDSIPSGFALLYKGRDRQVEEAFDVSVDVACLAEVSQGGAGLVSVIAVFVPARKYLHEVVVGGGTPLGGHSRSSVLEDGKCQGKAFLRGEVLGFVDKLQFPAPVSKVASSVEGR